MHAVRHWSVRHARGLETLLSRVRARARRRSIRCGERIGYERLERPVAAVERVVKGFLFDCRMCGQCVLSSTGMSCPMNCPKELRNGPCGGVRADGNCEVKPEMRCVWVEAIARQRADARRAARRCTSSSRRSTAGSPAARRGSRSRARSRRARASDELRRRAGAGLSAADPAGTHVARPPRARAARRSVRGDDRARPAGFRRPRGRLSSRARVRRLRRRDQRHRRQRRQLPHVEPRRLRAADARRLCAGDADLVPRQEPHRDPGRHPGRRGDGRLQHAVPHRRRRASRRPSAGQARVRSRLHHAARHRPRRCATSIASRAAARSRSRRACSSARPRIRSRRPSTGAPCRLAKKIAAGAQFIQTQYCYDVPRLRRVHGARRTTSGCSSARSSWSASGRCARPRPREWMRTHVPGVHIPDEIIRRVAGAQDQAREGRRVCIDLIQRDPRDQGRRRRARDGLPAGRSRGRSDHRSGVLAGRTPWHPDRNPIAWSNAMSATSRPAEFPGAHSAG